MTIAVSNLRPTPFGVANDTTGGYSLALSVFAALPLLPPILLAIAKKPERS
jgi:hypothetical protein